jgi:hypothetical protein
VKYFEVVGDDEDVLFEVCVGNSVFLTLFGLFGSHGS